MADLNFLKGNITVMLTITATRSGIWCWERVQAKLKNRSYGLYLV